MLTKVNSSKRSGNTALFEVAYENKSAGENHFSITSKEIFMSEFKNVTVVKKANVYFGGNVTSRTVLFGDGSKKTLGIMLPGTYAFETSEKEVMEILAGELEILLPGSSSWRAVKAGERFEVPAKSKFNLNIKTITDYCCSYGY
jgi:purine/pyrimidine-nucleoside phosphorylase